MKAERKMMFFFLKIIEKITSLFSHNLHKVTRSAKCNIIVCFGIIFSHMWLKSLAREIIIGILAQMK